MQNLIGLLCCLSLLVFGTALAQEMSVASLPASVIATVPRCGDTGVDAESVQQLSITFSKEMTRESFSLVNVSKETFPELNGKPAFSDDGTTCTVKVKLEAGKTYVLWVNSQRYQGFRDTGGKPSIPYLLVFQTK